MSAYYNDNDPYAVQWLKNLILAGHIPDGEVDSRGIAEVGATDVAGFSQCHFFAGIGGWAYALRSAGWDAPVWTGSCPCQPFSNAGKRLGTADARHLWPEFQRLISECEPATVFGEQVAGKAGRVWLAGVRTDLEALGYAVGAADLCAAGVGAPHIRQRLFWVADSASRVEQTRQPGACGQQEKPAGGYVLSRGMGNTNGAGREAFGNIGFRDVARSEEFANSSSYGGAGDAESCGDPDGCFGDGPPGQHVCAVAGTTGGNGGGDYAARDRVPVHERTGSVGLWSRAEWLQCLDGKARRVEPGIFPLVDGASARVGKLRASGNAIVPQVAAEFVSAFMECAP